MNTESNAVPEVPVDSVVIDRHSGTRPFFWSVRRELWENRSIYLAPLIAGAVALFGFFISTIGLPERRRAVLLLDAAQQRARIEQPYDMVAMILMMVGILVGIFYCLEALHGERRDRSILFWKSLPVSDFTTVLAKASIPLLVLPLVTFAVVVITQVIMMLWTAVLLAMNGLPLTTVSQLPFFSSWLVLLYGLAVMALWQAPLFAWFLLVSAWARRAAILWALLPISIGVIERIAFQTTYFPTFLQDRVFGGTRRHLSLSRARPGRTAISFPQSIRPISRRLISSSVPDSGSGSSSPRPSSSPPSACAACAGRFDFSSHPPSSIDRTSR
ncbi:MAG: ABC transporter permease [Verrucomicrobiota bacterium]|nr:ABC transporter permease [Verrucomicrobiota bacterium]